MVVMMADAVVGRAQTVSGHVPESRSAASGVNQPCSSRRSIVVTKFGESGGRNEMPARDLRHMTPCA